MKKLVIASNNAGKIKEIKRVLKDINIEVVSLKDIRLDIDVEEDGLTFEENAKKKSVVNPINYRFNSPVLFLC